MSGAGRQDARGGPPPPRDDGDDLVALAYGELNASEESALRARVASDPVLAERLGDMERVRSMFGAMEDEDPPPGLSAQLLAHAAQSARPAAREAAGASGSGEGFWARLRAWLAPIVAHPGLAAAASILLVAGVAGLLVARKGADFGRAERQAAESAASSEVDRAPGAARAEPPVAPPAPSEAPANAAAGPAEEQAALDDGEAEGKAAAKADDTVASGKLADRRSIRNRDAAKPRPNDQGSAAQTPPAGTALGLREGLDDAEGSTSDGRAELAKEKSGKDYLGDEDARGDAPAQAPAATTPAPPPPADSSTADPSPAKPASRPASVAELHKRAITAAQSRRCLEVQSIDRTIRSLDPKYSDSSFRSDR